MGVLVKMAFVNIWRNTRRSLITISAVAVGLAGLIFLWSFNDGMVEEMRENITRLFTGHVQVHAQGFQKSLSPGLTISDPDSLAGLLPQHPEFEAFAPRIKCQALVGTSEHSQGVLLLGIDPKQESRVTRIADFVRTGSFLTDEPGKPRLPAGHSGIETERKQILLGDRLAEKLEVGVGDKVVLLTQTLDGLLSGFAYRVQGLFHAGSRDLDEHAAYISLPSAQELLGLGDAVSELAIRLKRRGDIPGFVEKLRSDARWAGREVLPWYEVMPEQEQWVQWGNAVVRVIMLATTLVIAIGIMNTVIMSVFERTREFGVMLAVGAKPRQILTLILLETAFLEAVGISVGLAAGYGLVGYFGRVGLPLWNVSDALAMSFMRPVIHTTVYPHHVVMSVLVLIVVTTGVALYPALRAARLQPVQAIYHS